MTKKESSGFNTPFEGLRRIARQQPPAAADKPAAKPAATSKPPLASKPAAAIKPAAPATSAPATEDDQFFARAMRGVKPLPAGERGRRASPMAATPTAAAAAPRRLAPRRNDDADAEAELADLVSGNSRVSIDEDAAGVHAGRAPGIDRRLLRRLRDGDYPIEAQLDLHGRARDEAESILERFIAQSQSQGQRCVLVIHGRGLNSGDAGPVLRDAVHRILGGRSVGRAVLAFTLAAPAQGGDGATLVLLRKKKS